MKWIVAIPSVLAVMCLSLGCQMTSAKPAAGLQGRVSELPPIPDRLRAFYRDVQAGKFEILADFEQPAQAEIFHVEGSGSAGITVRRSQISTGAGALEVCLDGPESSLVIDGQGAANWTLSRDWGGYQLLMAGIHTAVPAVVNVQVRSGTDDPAWYVSQPRPLVPGWNLLRIDLAEVARRVNVADIRQVRLTAAGAAWPVTLHLDDLVLADNTQTLLSDPEGQPGSLYVIKRGQRYHIGAVGRFELVFSRGLLTGWYDLGSDPDRGIDLAGANLAGPTLTALDEAGVPVGGIGIDSWSGLGKGVQTHLQIVESSPLAVTIRGTIRFTSVAGEGLEQVLGEGSTTQGAAGASQPSGGGVAAPATGPVGLDHIYTYTIRQDGRVFVDIRAAVATTGWRAARIGLVLTSPGAIFEARHVDPLDADLLNLAAGESTDMPGEVPEARRTIPRALLLAGVREGGPNVLLVPADVGRLERILSATRPAGDVTAHMYVMPSPGEDAVRLAGMLVVWPKDLRDVPTAAAIARDYQEPTPPKVEVGTLRRDTDGDLDGDGFAEATGRWMVEPDGQILRLRWPAGHLRFWPMVHVGGLGGKACWPYLDGRIIKPVHRGGDGQAEFIIPSILSRPALLEVTIER